MLDTMKIQVKKNWRNFSLITCTLDYSIADYSGALLGILKRVPTVVLN